MQSIEDDLIFDFGMHHGHDTEYYLKKGFRVVALEANPDLCASARSKFAEHISSKRLVIIDRALYSVGGEKLSFFVNAEKDDWSSLEKTWAEKGGHLANEIQVESITLAEICEQFGVPRYIKCDVEGADMLFAEHLCLQPVKPKFVSVEAISPVLLDHLVASGYDRFQILNQYFNGSVVPPNPAREGVFADMRFNGHMSGLFGKELNPGRWVQLDECLSRFHMFMHLISKDSGLVAGWLDFHAARSESL